jgi:CHAT domain-containing protein
MTRAGEDRAAVEEMFATQREVNFKECRLLAFERRRGLQPERHPVRYPWIETQALITEDVCDDAPEMRSAGRALISNASSLAEANGYRLLNARIEMILAGDAGNVGDDETAERLLLKALRDLDSQDSPPYRIANTVSELQYLEQDSNRRYVAELSLKEAVEWLKLEGNHFLESAMRMLLARAEIRIGAMKEAENQLQLSQGGIEAFRKGNTGWTNFTEAQIFLANSLLERSDLEGAAYYLDQTAAHMAGYSDLWGLRAYAAALGQLQLARGHLDEAARTLETEIRGSEEGSVRGADQATVAEYAQQDHDLYAELAAVWLAQGRSPESVLALWERFRLRSRGLPIAQCPGIALDCEEPKLLAARRELGDNILIGQIVLLDRVLAYRADRNGVTWSQRPLRRQDVLDAARSLEQAVSSPLTSPETAAKLGAGLAPALVPPIPAKLPADSALLLEPDPMLVNLAWPVLPTRAGPLGLQYSLAEIRSLLASRSEQDAGGISEAQTIGKRALIVGASVASANESPLPEAMDEAWSVSRLLHSSSPLLGTQATTASVGQSLSSATIFHFAGHAVQTRNGTELLLAAASPKDATPWIDGAFLRRHPPRFCRLAVLSACATGTREESWNRPLQDIVETLGSLGVPEVVATRWQIDSEAALPFMDVFYGNLAQGKSVALALTSARRVQFAQSLYRNPYYWGAYYATGREMTSSEEESHAGNQRIAKAEEK